MNNDAFIIKESIENMTISECLETIDDLYKQWTYDYNNLSESMVSGKVTIFTFLQLALNNFDIDFENDFQLGTFESKRLLLIEKISHLQMKLLYDENSDDTIKEEYKYKLCKIFKSVIDADNSIKYTFYLKNSLLEEQENRLDLMSYNEIDMTANNAVQNLILFLLENLKINGIKRYRGDCYKRVYTQDGYDTHFWQRDRSIKEYIYHTIKYEEYPHMWANLTHSAGNAKAIVDYLENHEGYQFQEIKRDRHVFSFTNGIYIAKKEVQNDDYIQYTDEFIEYKNNFISSDIISSNYFPVDFDTSILLKNTITSNNPTYNFSNTSLHEKGQSSIKNDWYNILKQKCPNFLSIMNYQEWREDVQKVMCILIGRTLYNVNDLDGWQVIPYLLGQAGTGKSTILTRIIKEFYKDCDVGTLSNNIETKFGLSSLYDKLMIIGPEIKGNFSMEQSEFQSIISGEDVQIAVKQKQAKSEVWKVPLVCSGNEVPQFSDNAGSISRRLIVFLFNKKVLEGNVDTSLSKKLKKEIPYILYSCNNAYLEAVNKHASEDIWNFIPLYFKKSRDEMAETTNALVSFLNSDKVKYGPGLYVKESELRLAFNNHCKEINAPKAKWSKQYIMGPFENKKLACHKAKLKYPNNSNGNMYNSVFVFGIDLVREETENQEEEQQIENINVDQFNTDNIIDDINISLEN